MEIIFFNHCVCFLFKMHVLQQNTVKTAEHAAWLDPTKRVIVLSGIMEIGVSMVSKQSLSRFIHIVLCSTFTNKITKENIQFLTIEQLISKLREVQVDRFDTNSTM